MNDRPRLLPPDAFCDRGEPRRKTCLFLLAVAAIALWDLGGRSIFHHDLPRFGTIAREMVRSGDWFVPTQYGRTYANKPILYVWAVAGPSALVGDVTTWTLRLPSALALIATAWATYVWAFARTGSRATGRVAGLLVVTTYFVNDMGRVGRPDMLATAFGALAAAWIDRSILGKGRPRDALSSGLALGAGLLSKGPVVLLIPAALVLLPRAAISLRERARRARPGTVALVALAVVALWLVPAAISGGRDWTRRLVWDQIATRVEGKTNHLEAPWYYLWMLPLSALPWAPTLVLAPVAFAWRRVRERFGDGAHVTSAAAALLVLTLLPTKEIRYASVVVPPFAVAAAQMWAAFAARAQDAAKATRTLRALGVASLLGAAGGAFALATWPAAIPWGALPVLALVVLGLAALRRPAPGDAARHLVGRAAGTSLALAACGLTLFWAVFTHYLVTKAERENDAIAAVLDPGVPTVLFGADPEVPKSLTPDDTFTGAPHVTFVTDPAAIPKPAAAPRLFVICLGTDGPAAKAARGEDAVTALARERSDGRTLLVLRFGPTTKPAPGG